MNAEDVLMGTDHPVATLDLHVGAGWSWLTLSPHLPPTLSSRQSPACHPKTCMSPDFACFHRGNYTVLPVQNIWSTHWRAPGTVAIRKCQIQAVGDSSHKVLAMKWNEFEADMNDIPRIIGCFSRIPELPTPARPRWSSGSASSV